jgi:hypothetical protein
MTDAKRTKDRQRLEDLREDAINARNDTQPGAHAYGCLERIILEYNSAIDGLRF